MNSQPNILVIMSDQHSRHVLGCYGNDVVRTPNLDRLATEGMVLTDAYCPSPLCIPSRTSFMTARTPSRNRVWDNGQILHSGIPTWAHHLGAIGYETALVGRMHFSGPDQRHGFARRPIGELWAVHPGGPNPNPDAPGRRIAGNSQDRRSVEIAGHGRTLFQWFDDQVTPAACEYLQDRARRRHEGPFAAVVGYLLPHNPYVAPKELFDYYLDRVDVPPIEDDLPPTTRRILRTRGFEPPLSEDRIRLARAAYFALCEVTDRHVGRVLDCLDETGLADDTLVIYCSDHGDLAGEHGGWTKSSFYEGSAGVPVIARLPGKISAASRSNAVCNLLDLGPTFVDLAGHEPMTGVDGRSLWPILTGDRPADWPDETFSELVDLASWPRKPVAERAPGRPGRMIRSGRWKLWAFDDEEHLPPALFDLETDPDEIHDLAADPTHAATREVLLARLHSDWDPAFARDQSRLNDLDYAALTRYGHTVRPLHEDTLPLPDEDVESDVALL